MVRNLTDPDGDGTLEWQERVVDVDGDSLSIDLILDQVDGSNAADSNPSWLDFTTTTNTINTDETEVLVDITADTSGLSEGSTYTFEITADDGITTTTRTFTLEITESIRDLTPGEKVFVLDVNDNTYTQFALSTAQDIASQRTQEATYDFSSETSSVRGLTWKKNGKYLYAYDNTNNLFLQYEASTAYKVDTLTKINQYDPSANFGDGWDIDISSDGANFYASSNGNQSIYQWTLGTDYNISTASFLKSVNLGVGITGIVVSTDGSKMLLIDEPNAKLLEHSLNTAYEIANNEVDVANLYGNSPYGLETSKDELHIIYSSAEFDRTYDIGFNDPFDIAVFATDEYQSLVTSDRSPSYNW